jgi:phosphatidylethanolamine-binding protein (PEBP) family uncharacterized protein
MVDGKTLSGPWKLGKNYDGAAYEAPAPLFSHGEHQYVWQLFAVSAEMNERKLGSVPKIGRLVSEMNGRVWAWGKWM